MSNTSSIQNTSKDTIEDTIQFVSKNNDKSEQIIQTNSKDIIKAESVDKKEEYKESKKDFYERLKSHRFDMARSVSNMN